MEKIWIFGDSYSDIAENDDSWPIAISKKYKVENFSKCGTGPEYSLDILNQKVKSSSNLKDINLIFLISNIYRFDFNFYSKPEHQVLSWNIAKIVPNNKHLEKDCKPYNKYKDFLNNFLQYYLTHNNFEENKMLQVVGNINLFSKNFKKILVWPIFNKLPLMIESKNNFFVVNSLLSEIENNTYKYFEDTRPNHLTLENHKIMLDQISNWVDYNIPIDVSTFIKKS
jgi:hypothetical protein